MSDTAVHAPAGPGAGVDLLLLWHMHQPDYRDRASGEFRLPWVYLHACKDYSDMAWHLEQHPGMRAVVNFVPVLLDQIEDYGDQFRLGTLRDPLLRLLARDERSALTVAERELAWEHCFRANPVRLIAPFPAYERLQDLFKSVEAHGPASRAYLSDRYVFDLVTWYHLAWTGESVRRESEVVAHLLGKGMHFTHDERLALLRVIGDQVQAIAPRYAALAHRGQIEITTTPHFHPLAPLLLDFACARDALPEIALPESEAYPGGRERVEFHVNSAIASHARRFGATPAGVWPAEGAVSAEFAAILAARGFSWTGSGEGVLANSLRAAGETAAENGIHAPHRPYTVEGAPGLLAFFRDDRLSDLIGFSYSKWHGRDAAQNFVHELEAIGARAGDRARPLVCVMLDGENAWEYYPYNGYFFLGDLYRLVCAHPHIRTLTGTDVVRAHHRRGAAAPGGTAAQGGVPMVAPRHLPRLAAGSWVYGNLATWIGAKDKNRAWDLLCAAKRCFDETLQAGVLDEQRAGRARAQLADCEASDWFWWPGEENPEAAVLSFDTLFREKLAHLYVLLGHAVPESLKAPFTTRGSARGEEAEIGGTMRRGAAG